MSEDLGASYAEMLAILSVQVGVLIRNYSADPNVVASVLRDTLFTVKKVAMVPPAERNTPV